MKIIIYWQYQISSSEPYNMYLYTANDLLHVAILYP